MDKTQAGITPSAEAIEAAFGGRWRAWLSDTGWWWAARCELLNAADLGAGCVPFLRAQTQAGLIERIHDQEDLHIRAAGRPQQVGDAPRIRPARLTGDRQSWTESNLMQQTALQTTRLELAAIPSAVRPEARPRRCPGCARGRP
jgi:hypothetical protein